MSYAKEGSDATVRSQDVVAYDPRSGGTRQLRYSGLRSDIDTLYASLGANVVKRIDPIDGTPNAILTVDLGGTADTPSGTTPISTEWSYDGSNTSLSVLAIPRVKAALIGIPAAGLLRLRKRLETGEEPTASYHTDGTKNAELETAVQIADAGGEYYHVAPELVFTARYQAGSAWRPPAAYQNKIYTLVKLSSDFGLPEDMKSGLPTDADGEWLCVSVRYTTSSDGSRVFEVGWKFAKSWGRDLSGAVWAYPLA